MESTDLIKVNILLHGLSANYSGELQIPAELTVREAVVYFAGQQNVPLTEHFALICIVGGRRISEKEKLSEGDRLEAYQILGGG